MNAVVAEQIRTVVEARLNELAPVVAELEQLRSVLATLDDPGVSHRPAAVTATLRELERAGDNAGASVMLLPGRVRRGNKPGRDGRAPQGANKQRILAAIAEHPGIAAPRIAAITGLKRPLVASTISRLKRNGELEAHGEGVRLASAMSRPLAATR